MSPSKVVFDIFQDELRSQQGELTVNRNDVHEIQIQLARHEEKFREQGGILVNLKARLDEGARHNTALVVCIISSLTSILIAIFKH